MMFDGLSFSRSKRSASAARMSAMSRVFFIGFFLRTDGGLLGLRGMRTLPTNVLGPMPPIDGFDPPLQVSCVCNCLDPTLARMGESETAKGPG